jgi:thiol-disulfide isomerase/thioredoxin
MARGPAVAVLMACLVVLPVAGCLQENGPSSGGADHRLPHDGTTRGLRLPDLAFTDQSGAAGSLRNITAEFTVVQVESPVLAPFPSQFTQIKQVRLAMANLTVAALTLSGDPNSTVAAMAALRSHYGADWTFAVPRGNITSALSLLRFPTVFVLDKDKVVLNRSDEPFGEARILEAIRASLGQAPDPGTAAEVGKRAPEMVFRDIDGTEGSLGAWNGRVVMVEVWEIECPWCIELFHELKNLSANLSSSGLSVLSIDVVNWETDAMVRAIATQHNATWTFAVDGDNVQSRYSVWRVPALFLIDRQGVIRWTNVGYVAYPDLAIEVEKLI